MRKCSIQENLTLCNYVQCQQLIKLIISIIINSLNDLSQRQYTVLLDLAMKDLPWSSWKFSETMILLDRNRTPKNFYTAPTVMRLHSDICDIWYIPHSADSQIRLIHICCFLFPFFLLLLLCTTVLQVCTLIVVASWGKKKLKKQFFCNFSVFFFLFCFVFVVFNWCSDFIITGAHVHDYYYLFCFIGKSFIAPIPILNIYCCCCFFLEKKNKPLNSVHFTVSDVLSRTFFLQSSEPSLASSYYTREKALNCQCRRNTHAMFTANR